MLRATSKELEMGAQSLHPGLVLVRVLRPGAERLPVGPGEVALHPVERLDVADHLLDIGGANEDATGHLGIRIVGVRGLFLDHQDLGAQVVGGDRRHGARPPIAHDHDIGAFLPAGIPDQHATPPALAVAAV